MKPCSASAVLPLVAVAVLAASSVMTGCPSAREGRPIARCIDDCNARASSRCDEGACERGCKFILDRIVEREDRPVVTCVGAASSCGDETWASCAARVGVHADGGPPNMAPRGADPEGEASDDAPEKPEPAEKKADKAVKVDAGKPDKPAKLAPAKTPPLKPSKTKSTVDA